MLQGLRRLGLDAYSTQNRQRETDRAVLLGTTLWRDVEASGEFLLVDRAGWGDPDYVQLVWNGRGRRGDHRVPEGHGPDRAWLTLPEPMPMRSGEKIVLCGQCESNSPDWTLEGFYGAPHGATHFRPHPAAGNPTALPMWRSFDDVGKLVTLNSTVAIEALLKGVPVVAYDAGSLAYGVTDREEWLAWLAWTQWAWDEIAEGGPISHLFEDG